MLHNQEDWLQRGELAWRFVPKGTRMYVVKHNGRIAVAKKDKFDNASCPTLSYEKEKIEKTAAAINEAIKGEQEWESRHFYALKEAGMEWIIKVIRSEFSFLEDKEFLFGYAEIGFCGFKKKIEGWYPTTRFVFKDGE